MATLTLDDRDPSIVYSTGWSLGGASTEYNSTTTYTDNAGVTMSLTFQGIGITVHGTIGSSNSKRVAPQTTYRLDESEVVTYVPTLMASAQHYQRFYQSPQIPKRQHTLVVTNIIGGCDPFFVDFLVVQTGNSFNNASSTTTMSSAPGRTLGSDSASNSEQHRTAIIAGSVTAAIAGILLFGLTYFLIRRRKRRASVYSDDPIVVVGSVNPSQHTTGQRPASNNPKTRPSAQLHPPAHEYDQGTSSHRVSVPPPAYVP